MPSHSHLNLSHNQCLQFAFEELNFFSPFPAMVTERKLSNFDWWFQITQGTGRISSQSQRKRRRIQRIPTAQKHRSPSNYEPFAAGSTDLAAIQNEIVGSGFRMFCVFQSASKKAYDQRVRMRGKIGFPTNGREICNRAGLAIVCQPGEMWGGNFRLFHAPKCAILWTKFYQRFVSTIWSRTM